MKVATAESYEIEDFTPNLTRVAVRIHNVGHAMRVFAESTYSKPIEAVVRETIANAIDASRGAHFSVTAPSLLDPNFRVRDFGVGMDEAFFTDGYAAVGFSTKRDSDDEIGGFGQGRFAAFAYKGCDIFYVRAIKDGRWFRGSVSRDAEFQVFVQVEERGFTDEPNGVEVIIPVLTADHKAFYEAIQIYTEFVPTADTTVERLVRPTIMGGNGWRLSSVNPDDRFAGHKQRAIMGGVPYPIDIEEAVPGYSDYSLKEFARNLSRLDLHFPIGALSVAASREALRYDDPTKEALKAKFREIMHDVQNHQAELEFQCKTEWEKRTKPEIIAFRRLFGRGYASMNLSDSSGISLLKTVSGDRIWPNRRGGWRSKHLEFSPGKVFHIIYVDDPRAWRIRLDHYMQDLKAKSQNPQKEYVIVVDSQAGLTFLGDPPFTKLSEVPKPPPKPRMKREPRPVAQRFTYHHTSNGWTAQLADYSTPGIYVPFKISCIDDEWQPLFEEWPLATKPIGVPAADIKTAEANGWIRFDTYLRNNIPPEVLRAWGIQQHISEIDRNVMDAAKVLTEAGFSSKRPAVARFFELYNAWATTPTNWFRAFEILKIAPPAKNVRIDQAAENLKKHHPALYALMAYDCLDNYFIKNEKEAIILLATKCL